MAEHAVVNFIRKPGRASTVLHPLRMRILHILREPGSAAQVARSLKLPRQRVNYHLRELEDQGLVELVEERLKGNCVERVVRATADSYLISPEALGELAPEAPAEDRFHPAYLVALAADVMRDLSMLRARTRESGGKEPPTFALEREVRFASAEDRKTFLEDAERAITELATKYARRNGGASTAFRVVIGGHPAVDTRGQDPKTTISAESQSAEIDDENSAST